MNRFSAGAVYILGSGLLLAIAVVSSAQNPDPATLRNNIAEKKAAIATLLLTQKKLSGTSGPAKDQNDCALCAGLITKCNAWEKLARTHKEAFAKCELGDCTVDVRTPRIEACEAIAQSDCPDHVLAEADAKYVASCWRVVRMEKDQELARSIAALEVEIRQTEVELRKAIDERSGKVATSGTAPKIR